MELVYKKGALAEAKKAYSPRKNKYAALLMLSILWVMKPFIKSIAAINGLRTRVKFYVRMVKWGVGKKDPYMDKLIRTVNILNAQK